MNFVSVVLLLICTLQAITAQSDLPYNETSSEEHRRKLWFWNTAKKSADLSSSATAMHNAHLFGSPEILKGILANNTDYKKRYPFPHLYIDDFFPSKMLAAISKEIPEHNRIREDGCVEGNSKCAQDTVNENKKSTFDKDEAFGPATLAVFAYLRSSRFLRFLESLTGINDLIPDPHYLGSGIELTLPGGHMQVHADSNRYDRYKMHRRVNVFLYLNPDWKDEYGGHLELWDSTLKHCGAMIRPNLGRLVIMSSTDFTYHGHPQPLACPSDRSRRSLALYYYTSSRPVEECVDKKCDIERSTLFQNPACSSCMDPLCRKVEHVV